MTVAYMTAPLLFAFIASQERSQSLGRPRTSRNIGGVPPRIAVAHDPQVLAEQPIILLELGYAETASATDVVSWRF